MSTGNGGPARNRQRLAWAGLSLALLLAGYHPATAEGEPPRLPQASFGPMQVDIPAAPAGVTAVLVERMAVDASPARYSSQDFVVNFDDSQGADDFCIPPSDPFWKITNVDVVGTYNAGNYAVSTVNVFFLNWGGSLPGIQTYAVTVSGASVGNAGTGSFALTLPAAALLPGDRCYWLSVQAMQPGGFDGGETWQWTQRTAATSDHNPAAYRWPGKPGHACQNWTAPLTTCFEEAPTNADFTFRLSGSVVSLPYKTNVPLIRR
jgi:hypothetical protein